MRYIVLVLLNVPVILLALVNIITQYKLKKVTRARFRHQITLWLAVLIVLIGSFPVYNIIAGYALLDSSELSFFDIFQTTALVLLFYIVNNQRQKIEHAEKTVRDLHQEISIKLSVK